MIQSIVNSIAYLGDAFSLLMDGKIYEFLHMMLAFLAIFPLQLSIIFLIIYFILLLLIPVFKAKKGLEINDRLGKIFKRITIPLLIVSGASFAITILIRIVKYVINLYQYYSLIDPITVFVVTFAIIVWLINYLISFFK